MSGSEVANALIPRAASSGREAARLSFVSDSHSLLFGIQKRERERERESECERERESSDFFMQQSINFV